MVDREPLLSVRDLTIDFSGRTGGLRVVNGVSFDVFPGETLSIVGESGSGKTVTALSILGLLPSRGCHVRSGEVLFNGVDLLSAKPEVMRRARGKQVSMVFQDPTGALNPLHTVGTQIAEAITAHDPRISRAGARARAVQLLQLVGIPSPEERAKQYPHHFSGGMAQRVMIAMAIANDPKLIIADEPTTALDVTVQAQVFDVMEVARRETDAAIILITHDLGVVAQLADRLVVMYAGRVVESGPVQELFHRPQHPYTLGLMASLPRLGLSASRLAAIPGSPPNLKHKPPGCEFHPRCRLSRDRDLCRIETPPLAALVPGADHSVSCHFSEEMEAEARHVWQEMGVAERPPVRGLE